MAGHSKWANIKYRKEKADAKKGKVFSRIAKEIISAVKIGGADPQGNPRLRVVLIKAREANVPNDVVDRNIKKGANADQQDFTEMTYELYGHGGVGLIVDVMTDNKNRISSDMRIATNKRGGSVATPGSVAFNFERKGILTIPQGAHVEDDLFLTVTEAGAEDFEKQEDSFIVTTDPQSLYQVKEALLVKGITCSEATLDMIPKTWVTVDEETAKANQELIDWLEALDDVDAVFHNME